MKGMIFRFSLLLVATLILTASDASAQTTSDRMINPAVVVRAVAPKGYPDIARVMKADGKVVVEVKINSTGKVISTKIISGHLLLHAPSVEAAKRWLFSAADKKIEERSVELEFIYTHATKKDDAGVFFMPPYRVEIIAATPEIQY